MTINGISESMFIFDYYTAEGAVWPVSFPGQFFNNMPLWLVQIFHAKDNNHVHLVMRTKFQKNHLGGHKAAIVRRWNLRSTQYSSRVTFTETCSGEFSWFLLS